jgi:hypothetical protein
MADPDASSRAGVGLMGWEEDDEDYRIEAMEERRARNRATRCQCGSDLPGTCPGPISCPYSDFNQSNDEE